MYIHLTEIFVVCGQFNFMAPLCVAYSKTHLYVTLLFLILPT